MSEEYLIQCWYCLGEYDAGSAVWCSCDPKSPTKLCPYCLQCFCRSSEEYRSRFFQYAPPSLLEERSSLRKIKDRLGELLVRSQILSMEDLLTALSKQADSGKKLGEILVEGRILSEEELELFLTIQKVPIPNEFSNEYIDLEMLHRLNPEFCLQRKILPLRMFQSTNRSFLALAMADPQDLGTIDIVARKTEVFVVPFYGDEFAISSFLTNYVPPGGIRLMEQETIDYQAMIRKIILGAIKRHATDIHIEPDQKDFSIRYRIDGVLYKIKSPPKRDQGPLMTALKKLAKMDLQKSGIPQSSKMFLKLSDKKYQLNILSFPNPYGESISLKIVDLSTFLRDLSETGLEEEEYVKVQSAIDSSHGLVIVSGPLLNGCNTTQYAMMGYLSRSNRKIMTLESPIFSSIPNIHQSEINPSVGFDFVTGLNSIIHSDPDVIFISDIPDAEVAAAVCKVAARCVVAVTLNAISAANAIVMLRELGASPTMLSQALSLVVNQRLIRKICRHCGEKLAVSQSLLVRMGLNDQESELLNAYIGAGCKECNYLGFSGRIAIFEVLVPTPEVTDLIARGASAKEIETAAIQAGMVSLRKRCLQKINEGITTLEEFQKCKF